MAGKVTMKISIMYMFEITLIWWEQIFTEVVAMIGESGIDLSILYKFKARYKKHQTSFQMLTETHFLMINVARTAV
jgi:hypothetical protein